LFAYGIVVGTSVGFWARKRKRLVASKEEHIMGTNVISALGDYGCDTQSALERFLGKEELYLKFIRKFLDDKSFEDLKGFIGEEDYENALKSVHTLKGVSGNLGFTALYDVASDMVNKFRAQLPGDAVAEFGMLENIYTEIYSIIRENVS